jgi:hypothetical protein
MPDTNFTRRVLEQDRKVQLKMRLALKRLHGQMPSRPLVMDPDGQPEPEMLGRLIAKVRKL